LGAATESATAIGVCGGDGSINTAAQIALEHDKPLVVVPGGTFNHLSQALGIECVEDAVEAVKAGRAAEVDVATIDGHVFLNTASFGSYVELVDAREKLENSIGKWPAVLVALIRVLRGSDPVEVEIDGHDRRIWMAFVGNCRYQPSGFAPSWRERLDDRKLDVRYVDASQAWARLRLVTAIVSGRLGRSKVYKQTVVEEFRLRSRQGPLRLARDGETFEGSDDIVIRKLPERLRVFVPQENQ
jgi:undecaprenyl-diphosphatase